MKVQLIKLIRYGMRIFEIGEIGTTVNVAKPITFNNKPIYDYYVRFPNHKPIGLFKTEVEEMK